MLGRAAALSAAARAAKNRGASGIFVKTACRGTLDSAWLPRQGCHQEASAWTQRARSHGVAGWRGAGNCLFFPPFLIPGSDA